MSQRIAPELLGTVTAGFLAAILLLAVVSRPSHAEKAQACRTGTTSLCETIERCSGGFEPDGSCRWIYTIQRYYWSN